MIPHTVLGDVPSDRSSSPAIKRPASVLDDHELAEEGSDVDMTVTAPDHEAAALTGIPSDGPTGNDSSETASSSPGSQQRQSSPSTVSADNPAVEKSDADPLQDAQQPPSTSSTATATGDASSQELPTSSQPAQLSEIPSIDEQIIEVTKISMRQLKNGEKGYVVASKWLDRVRARGSAESTIGKADKAAMEGEVGPVDNTDLISQESYADLKDVDGEPFIPLKPGLTMGEDYEIFPEDAWKLVLAWYGNSHNSPVITRFVRDTNPDGEAGMQNLQYESYPPLYIVSKLPAGSDGMSIQSLREKDASPVKAVASRSEPFNGFLKRIKQLAGIPLQTKVRTWRIIGKNRDGNSQAPTPSVSRSISPAPSMAEISSADVPKNLIYDLNDFISLEEGSHREVLEIQDQTMNEKYNGHLSLSLAGLAQDAILVLEEQIGGPGGGEWVSEGTKKKASGHGLNLNVPKAGVSASQAQRRLEPKQEPSTGMMTRGRLRKDGRALGTCGLSNLGNTCYMNSALQCVRSVEELTQYFRLDKYKAELNPANPLSHNGEVASSYAHLLEMMYAPSSHTSIPPRQFKNTIGRYAPSFSGFGQQDSQEFLGFLLDGLQEDLNRIHKKPFIEKPDSTDEMVNDPKALRELAEKCWDIYKARNDSVIADLFAGTFKSTLVCPFCHKVSITFDPFNNLTLQLPVENTWSKEVYFFPLDGRPVKIMVDMDKNGSIKALKEYMSSKVNVDSNKLHAVEIYKSKVYKVYDDFNSVSESIQSSDDVAIIEIEEVPTNFPAPRKKKGKPRSMLSLSYGHSDDDEPWAPELADKLLVPVFSRVSKDPNTRFPSRTVFSVPLYIIVSRAEAQDYDAILKKVLRRVATLTTRDILDTGSASNLSSASTEDDDLVLTTAEDADSSAGTKTRTDSSEGDDGFVDVSMKEADSSSPLQSNHTTDPGITEAKIPFPKVLEPGSYIPPELQTLFQMKYFTQKGELVPTGWNAQLEDSRDLPSIASRIRQNTPESLVADEGADQSSGDTEGSSGSEIDQIHQPPHGSNYLANDPESESDEDSLPAARNIMERRGASKKNRGFGRKRIRNTYTKKGKHLAASSDDEQEGPLIRLGEGILLEWTAEAYDALFTGARTDDSMRGCATWDRVDVMPDEELKQKRALRLSRRKKGVSLGDCLDEFGKEEILSENDAWYCPRCKEHRRASKKIELWKCPDILIMHLKRFSANRGFRDKIDVLVDFPIEGLDLNERVALKEDGKSELYDLIAVDNHYGGLGGGHYTAHAKNFIDGQWYEYNDTMVSRKNPQQAITSAAYLLFYRRRSEKPLGGPALEQVVEDANRVESAPSSRAESPAGDGQRLDGSFPTGSSSALIGVGAAHQGAGLAEERSLAMENDGLPAYSSDLRAGEVGLSGQQDDDMQIDEGIEADVSDVAIAFGAAPTWSFAMNDPAAPTMEDNDENLLDGASDQAADGSSAGLSDPGTRMADFDDEEHEGLLEEQFDRSHNFINGQGIPGVSAEEDIRETELMVAAPTTSGEEDDDVTDAPVAEVHLEEDESLFKTE